MRGPREAKGAGVHWIPTKSSLSQVRWSRRTIWTKLSSISFWICRASRCSPGTPRTRAMVKLLVAAHRTQVHHSPRFEAGAGQKSRSYMPHRHQRALVHRPRRFVHPPTIRRADLLVGRRASYDSRVKSKERILDRAREETASASQVETETQGETGKRKMYAGPDTKAR